MYSIRWRYRNYCPLFQSQSLIMTSLSLPSSDNSKIIEHRVLLNSGSSLPVISFGTFRIVGRNTIHKVLDAALGAGYRGIDTASVYGNEQDIGHVLKQLLPKYKLRREDIFITTKLAPSDHGDEKKVTAAVNQSLSNLNTSYIDLYLIHWPGVSGVPSSSQSNLTLRSSTWNSLVKLHDYGKGVLKSIGVSNYTTKHLHQLLETSPIVPSVNQVEFHPHWQQSKDFHEICKQYNIVPQAYSSLGGSGNDSLVKDAVIETIAKKYSLSPAQVLLRWSLQRGYAVVPKSVTADRIVANADLNIPLDQSDMNIINNINKKCKYAWNPDVIY